MVRTLLCFAVGAVTLSLIAGCSQPEPPKPVTDRPSVTDMTNPAPPLPPPGPSQLPYPRGGRMELVDQGDGTVVQPRSEGERTKAQVGVGAKGRSLENPDHVQMIVTPALALFRTQERLVFEAAIPQAMNLFEATNGRKPNSHEEFWEQIIGANNIRLPELPAGQRYVYDPNTAELMVEKPAQ